MKKKYLGMILIVFGAFIIITALSIRFYGEYRQNKLLKDFEKSMMSIDKEETASPSPLQSPSTASASALESSPEVSAAPVQNTQVAEPKGTIGIMMIPKISLKVAVSEGTDQSILKYAVGHFKGTASPGEIGNSSFAGHRSYAYNEFFNRLDEMTIGDEIIVRTKKGEFKYKVYEKKVVLPTEVSVLNPTKDATITLVTCTPIRVATHRLIIKGRLES
jgi:sortase A